MELIQQRGVVDARMSLVAILAASGVDQLGTKRHLDAIFRFSVTGGGIGQTEKEVPKQAAM